MKKIVLTILSVYNRLVSPALVRLFGHACRFEPSCSIYAGEAIGKLGPFKGGGLAIKRFFACQPFSKRRYYDPVPNNFKF